MTIIAFPTPRPIDEIPPVERGRLLALIVGAVRHLGEPATTAEIADVLRPLITAEQRLHIRRDVGAIIQANASDTPSPLFGCVMFRSVPLGRSKAWAFTEGFRLLLRTGGLETPLRPHAP